MQISIIIIIIIIRWLLLKHSQTSHREISKHPTVKRSETTHGKTPPNITLENTA